MIDFHGNCFFPIFTLPPPNKTDANKSGDEWLGILEGERNTWFLGTMYFEKYFMVFDNTPF